MNKGELITVMASTAGITKKEAEVALDTFLTATKNTLRKEGKVVLAGFGTFKVGQRKARTGRNPQTGAEIKISAKKVAKFVPGKSLKDAVGS